MIPEDEAFARLPRRGTDLVYMGSFLPYKNVETLLRAMAHLPGRTLHLLSRISPARRAELQAQVPAGLTVATVPADTAFQSAMQSVGQVQAAAITPAARSRFSLPASVNGVVITNVEQGSAAARLGFQPGFVITRANDRNITSAADLRAAVAAAKQAGRPSILLFVRTPQGTSPVPLKFATGE